MSKKYVIDLPDDAQYILINGASENHCYTRVEQVDDLEELNSDYINEHFSDLQDTAYQKGFEDGKNSIDKGCEGCEHEGEPYGKSPCDQCCNAYINQYTPMPKHTDRIEVGDEVIDKDGDTTIVTNIHERLFDGLCSDGSTMSDLFLEDVRKTGRHYDHIGKLLEAMRTHD